MRAPRLNLRTPKKSNFKVFFQISWVRLNQTFRVCDKKHYTDDFQLHQSSIKADVGQSVSLHPVILSI